MTLQTPGIRLVFRREFASVLWHVHNTKSERAYESEDAAKYNKRKKSRHEAVDCGKRDQQVLRCVGMMCLFRKKVEMGRRRVRRTRMFTK